MRERCKGRVVVPSITMKAQPAHSVSAITNPRLVSTTTTGASDQSFTGSITPSWLNVFCALQAAYSVSSLSYKIKIPCSRLVALKAQALRDMG